MKAAFSLAVWLLLSSAASGFADTVELNGITSLFGEKLAFMVLHRLDRNQPVSFVLSEGGSQFGVKLLAVDVLNARVQIEQAGQLQSVRLCSAPAMAMILTKALAEDAGQYPVPRQLTPQEQTQIQNFLSRDQDVSRIPSGNPIYLGAATANPGSAKSDAAPVNNTANGPDGTVANNGPADPDTAQPPASSPGDPTGDTSSSSPVDYTKQYWYVTSVGIERNRLATANQVLDGAMEPLPRTPLTPPGTPPVLIGPETFFPNQIPGFAYGGSVD
jgi:hypothetical protein